MQKKLSLCDPNQWANNRTCTWKYFICVFSKKREKNKSQIQWNTQLKLKFRIECNGRGVDSFDLQIDVNIWMKQKQKKRKEINRHKSPSLIEEIQWHQQRWRKRMCHIPLSFKRIYICCCFFSHCFKITCWLWSLVVHTLQSLLWWHCVYANSFTREDDTLVPIFFRCCFVSTSEHSTNTQITSC